MFYNIGSLVSIKENVNSHLLSTNGLPRLKGTKARRSQNQCDQ